MGEKFSALGDLPDELIPGDGYESPRAPGPVPFKRVQYAIGVLQIIRITLGFAAGARGLREAL